MNRLDSKSRAQIVRTLCEGNSIRATSRLCGCAVNTVVKLLLEVGPACITWHSENVTELDSMLVQVDEIWSFVGCKEKHATEDKKAEGQGDCWTWTALDSDSKLMISWNVGPRNESACRDFIDDLAYRLKNRIQLSSDGLDLNNDAVKLAFGPNVDYGQIIKTYGQDFAEEKRYSPAICNGVKTKAITGDPMDSLISTSHVERQNLNIRMGCRRFTRLTNAFSKKVVNHEAAISMYFMFYNFCRPHKTLTQDSGAAGNRYPTTPAMKAGSASEPWTVEAMIAKVLGESN
jgi:IS1 family transposase